LLDGICANGDWPSPYPWKNFYASCRSRTVSAKRKIEGNLQPSANTALDELVWWAKATMVAKAAKI
jgi:hypothetical protein